MTPCITSFYSREPYVSNFFSNGREIQTRLICPDDEPGMIAFHRTLSGDTVYHRYFHMMGLSSRIEHTRLNSICHSDPKEKIVLVAEFLNENTKEIVAVARLSRISRSQDVEFAIVVSDSFQGMGIGTHLLRQLIKIARHEKLDRIIGSILVDNHEMQRLCRKLGFELCNDFEERIVNAHLNLRTP